MELLDSGLVSMRTSVPDTSTTLIKSYLESLRKMVMLQDTKHYCTGVLSD